MIAPMLGSVQLGQRSGLRVSRLCLGTMNFGEPGRGHQGDWTLGEADARPIFAGALERGLYYFDCADFYGLGACEALVGKLLREGTLPRPVRARDQIAMPMGRGANQGESRESTCWGVDGCLDAPGLDYVDHS
jgi:aryl-alcohol dehydrogenase-like predicted oxidoreductase